MVCGPRRFSRAGPRRRLWRPSSGCLAGDWKACSHESGGDPHLGASRIGWRHRLRGCGAHRRHATRAGGIGVGTFWIVGSLERRQRLGSNLACNARRVDARGRAVGGERDSPKRHGSHRSGQSPGASPRAGCRRGGALRSGAAAVRSRALDGVVQRRAARTRCACAVAGGAGDKRRSQRMEERFRRRWCGGGNAGARVPERRGCVDRAARGRGSLAAAAGDGGAAAASQSVEAWLEHAAAATLCGSGAGDLCGGRARARGAEGAGECGVDVAAAIGRGAASQ